MNSPTITPINEKLSAGVRAAKNHDIVDGTITVRVICQRVAPSRRAEQEGAPDPGAGADGGDADNRARSIRALAGSKFIDRVQSARKKILPHNQVGVGGDRFGTEEDFRGHALAGKLQRQGGIAMRELRLPCRHHGARLRPAFGDPQLQIKPVRRGKAFFRRDDIRQIRQIHGPEGGCDGLERGGPCDDGGGQAGGKQRPTRDQIFRQGRLRQGMK
jgi:hypothetical protein